MITSIYPKLRVLGVGLACLDIIQRGPNTIYLNGGTCGNVISALSALGWDSNLITWKYTDAAGTFLEKNIDSIGVTRIEVGKPNPSTPRFIEKLYSIESRYNRHEFLLRCPKCGKELPKFKAFSQRDVGSIINSDDEYNVFYSDRCSPGINSLRKKYSDKGAWTVFESNSSRNLNSFFDNSLESSIVKFSSEKIPFSVADKLKCFAENGNILLIVQTMGKDGLRFCYRKKDNNISAWFTLPAQPVTNLVDAAGAGDWCTTGLLAALVAIYNKRPKYLTKDESIKSLQYGQAFSAISCSFVGGQGLLFAGNGEDPGFNQLIQGVKIPKLIRVTPEMISEKGRCCELCLQDTQDIKILIK